VPDPETSLAVWVPSLILQPLVENAVVHGLADPQATVTIRVEAAADGESLILRVINSLTAKGSSAGAEQPGIGLKNVRERLAIQFGARAAFRSAAGHHDWVAELRLPMLYHGA
jgi:LytS/YehU family sensor histidine kinase